MGSINQNLPTPSLPDFRNLGVILRILIAVNVMALLAVLARGNQFPQMWTDFSLLVAILQPILLLSIVVLGAVQPWLARMTYTTGVAAVVLIELAIVAAVYWAFHSAMAGFQLAPFWECLLFALVICGVLLFYFHLRGKALSPAITEARLQALQARIRPHFLFNSITAVLSLMRQDAKRAERALEDLADLFRVLMADNRQLTPLEDEVALTRQYLELEQLRLGERLQIVWHIEKMPPDALIPPLVLQPLVENAVYHGIEPSAQPGELTINIYQHRNQVFVVVRNPYLGEGGSHHAGNKMAMNNIRERLALHFDVEGSLKTQVTGSSYQVTITFPYRPHP
jgi:two-component system, LytTR family, sensor histidine kinase AlgZ